MSAKEMFEELGYEQTLQYDEDIKEDLIAIRYKNRHNIEIIFDLWDCDFVKFGKIWEHLGNSSITMDELKAINQQCKELGWNK